MVGRPKQITGHLANTCQGIAYPAVDGRVDNLAIVFGVRLLLSGKGSGTGFRCRLIHAVEHTCLIIHTIRDAGNMPWQADRAFRADNHLKAGQGRQACQTCRIAFSLSGFGREQPIKFRIGVVAQLLCDGGGLPLDAQELPIWEKLHDFIGGQQVAARDVV